MRRHLHRLTDLSVRKAKPTTAPYKLSDGGGLYLLVQPNGARYWRLKYRLGGKERVYALGVYPNVSLAEARDLSAAGKKLVSAGIDPVQDRQGKRVIGLNESSWTIVWS